MNGSKKKRQEKVGHTEKFQVKKKKMSKENRRFYLSEEKVTGKDFSDNNIYCGTVALLEGLF